MLSPTPIFAKIGQRVLAWRGVEFWPFPLTCSVAIKPLSHYHASVWFGCSEPCIFHGAMWEKLIRIVPQVQLLGDTITKQKQNQHCKVVLVSSNRVGMETASNVDNRPTDWIPYYLDYNAQSNGLKLGYALYMCNQSYLPRPWMSTNSPPLCKQNKRSVAIPRKHDLIHVFFCTQVSCCYLCDVTLKPAKQAFIKYYTKRKYRCLLNNFQWLARM